MDDKFKNLFTKVKDQATFVADVAGQKSKEVYEVSKNNLKSFDLNTEIEAIYKEIGKLVYQSHKGADIAEETIAFKVAEIERRQEEINALKNRADMVKNTTTCPNCNAVLKKEDKFCSNCGMTF